MLKKVTLVPRPATGSRREMRIAVPKKGLAAMSVADQIRDHQARCVAALISLRMLAQGEAGLPLPRWVVVEVAQATGTVLAEAEAASRAALTAAGGGGGNTGAGAF